MIDISTEAVKPPSEIAKDHVPRRRAGKKCNVATVYRWMQHGVRGIRLEFIQVGGVRCTSLEALQRFFDALTAQAEGQPVETPQKLTAARRKQIKDAEQRLEKAGV